MPSPSLTAGNELLRIYARNIDYQLFRHNWTPAQLAQRLNTSPGTLSRVRLNHNRNIDPELFADLLRVFNCSPNELLCQQPNIDYTP